MSKATVMIRRRLIQDLEAAGFHELPLFQILEASVDDESPEPVDLFEQPDPISPPGPYRRPQIVEVSAALVSKLKRAYGPRSADHPSRRLGELPEVSTWLASLSPGKIQPRASA